MIVCYNRFAAGYLCEWSIACHSIKYYNNLKEQHAFAYNFIVNVGRAFACYMYVAAT